MIPPHPTGIHSGTPESSTRKPFPYPYPYEGSLMNPPPAGRRPLQARCEEESGDDREQAVLLPLLRTPFSISPQR